MPEIRHRLLPTLVGLVCLLSLGCKPVLVRIGFVDAGAGAGGDNEHVIHQNSTSHQGWGDGAAITDPVWIADGSDQDSLPDKNEPVCYVLSKPGSASRLKVEVTVKGDKNKQFNLVGYDGTTTYFRKNGLTATGQNQKVAMVADVDLPGAVSILQKTFKWKWESVGGQAAGTEELGSSTHKIYVIFDQPITTVESQSNKLTPKRLDFAAGAASGKSAKVDVAHAIAAKTDQTINGSYGQMTENPRWLAYSRSLNLDCHHRAALAASAFGIVGIEGHVHKVFATVHPVPPYGGNPTVNDYVSDYPGHRFKRRVSGCTQKLIFPGNNFEGNLRIEDGSADDGNQWWTIWPFKKHATAKALLKWYASSTGSQYWYSLSWCSNGPTVPIPTAQLANKPKIIGGPN